MNAHSVAGIAGINRVSDGVKRRDTRRVATGYVPRSLIVHRLYNLAIGLALFVLVLPLFTAISLALLMTQGRDIFYAGRRIGRDGRIFSILKFRTLDSERAAALTRDGVLPDGSGAETPLGGFLRATRLDELPQLINVVRGDMNLVGPRPVRPEIAAIYASEIPNYNVRFRVKPGLLGHTQAFMSHGTSKHIRARYNSLVCDQPVCYRKEVGLIAVVGLCVLFRSIAQTTSLLCYKVFGTNASSVLPVRVEFLADSGRKWPVSALDRQAITFADPTEAAPASGTQGSFVITLPDRHVRRARVVIEMHQDEDRGDMAEFRYRPLTDFSYYIISRYVLGQVVVPQKSLMLPGWIRSFFFRDPSLADAPQATFTRDARQAPFDPADLGGERFSPRSAQI